MKQFLRKNKLLNAPPAQQTIAFKMYVKKGWYGLPVVLMLLFGCAHHMATKDEMPEENLKVKKTEKKEILKYGVKQWEVTLNPHPKVLEFREGFGEMRNKYQFYFDTIPGKIDRDEAVEIAKQLLKCEATNDFIYLPDDHKFYNKQPEYKHLSKVGHWYHKGMLVLSHSIDFFNGTYEGETVNNRLTIHFDKRLDADLSKIISLDSAVKIIKAQHDLSDSELCWDTPHNTNCFPQPELKIGLNMNNVKPLRYHIQYHFSYDLDKKVPSIYVVDAYTGHFTYRGGGRKSYVCSLSSCTKCVGSTITDDAGCTEYSPPTTPLPSSYSLVTSETGLMYPTYYDGCKSIVEIETGENAGINYRLFNAVHPHYTINTYTNCTLAGPSDPNLILNTCKTGPEFASPLINKSFTCQERSVLNALDAIHKTQNFVADHFVERNIYTNSANYFSNIKPVNTYIGIDEDGAYYAQD